jgi:HAD superfamily hydrolase (TIGR01509 family)
MRCRNARDRAVTPPELVIFDCDGVLVDSEPISNRVFCSMLNELGLDVTLDYMFEHFVGLSMPQCVQRITAMRGAPPPPDFLETLRERTEQALRAEVTPVPGIPAVLQEIGVRFCVASSGSHAKIRVSLGATGLLDHFAERIFSVADVAAPKPAPDIFLHAAHRMGADPARCVVVEDSPTGVRAGVAAGMRVLGFSRHTPAARLRLAGAHVVFDDMGCLLGLLRSPS